MTINARTIFTPYSTRLGRCVTTLLLITFGMALIGMQADAAVGTAVDQRILTRCKNDLAKRTTLTPRAITLADAKAVTWPNAALGVPQHDMAYAEVLTPGWLITLNAHDRLYLYTASAKAFRYGGPVASWASSILYLMPTHGDPNFNGALMQGSLLGTNNACLLTEVSDFYPQANGKIIAKRRTSRSGHDLLYLNADEPGKPVLLHSALDFGAAATDATNTRWAALVRPRLGSAWNVTVANLADSEATPLALPMPDGVQPVNVPTGKIVWTESGKLQLELSILDRIVIEQKFECFEIDPQAASPAWNVIPCHTFVGNPDFMLNKSETLEVIPITRNAKTVIEVSRLWFTGTRKIIATISGENFTLNGWDLLGGRFAVIWGMRKDEQGQTAYTVDIVTGEVMVTRKDPTTIIKPFDYPPYAMPFRAAQTSQK